MDSHGGMTIFVQVAESRSFATAGRQLGISASAVSKGVARLEQKLGVRLFQRSTRSVSLTAEGALFLERCRRILAEIAAAEHELASTTATPQGRLRVSLPLVSGLMWPVLSAFASHYRQIELDLDFSDRLVDVVDEGFDAVVRTGELSDSRLMSKRLGISRFVCVGAPGYFEQHDRPQQPEDIARHACLLHRVPSTGLLEKWRLRRRDEDVDLRPAPSMTSNHLETLRHMAIQGHGIAYLPDFAVKAALDRGELVTVLDDWAGSSSTFWVLWPSNRQLLPRVRAFVDFMAEHLFPAGSLR
ncbi:MULTISPECIES: LysR family transcriptional regulator [Pseudomonas]|uniref:LysR family transcriptional regulator n=1 Tax=Pseudomonas sessilinigenes TaxID=658629 RepID=A0ABX8MIJ1_9PSED|nr:MULTISPECIES: LysR family transcriptional regulator [Pseudomonas]AZC26943.1 Transcriptional regulator, LysR family [Pseudomonas sessilinigenes]QXH39094.1 LysR family transcriptional regulator [Pseudomonas sessilinigenes]UMZ09357.1 LysR family transcriptional regulator [Pseudomonas sp. MPFS]